uniref:Cyclic AMP-dependent transcription factor ATF-4 n=1 Tax=Nothobranchius pienaari TaxID=704102 RepID=A0A1A8MM00_9TELE
MTLSQLAMEDVEALYLGSSFLMADTMVPLLDQDEEEALSPSSSLEVKAPASPSLFPSYASSSPFQTMSFSPLSSSPPSSPLDDSASFLGTKSEPDLMSLSLLGTSNLLGTHVGADNVKADAFDGLDWMCEKIYLNEFDLDSLIGSCSSDESPSSPEDLLASLDSHMDLDLDLDLGVQHSSPDQTLLPDIPSIPMETSAVPETKATEVADVEDDVKSEPSSPPPSSPPVYTLELESEVDVLDDDKLATPNSTAIIQNPSEVIKTTSPIMLCTSDHIVVVLSSKQETSLISISNPSLSSSPSHNCDSDSGIESGAGSPERHSTPPSSPTSGSSRTKPYSKPLPSASPSPKASKVKSASGAPKVVEKKLKKMEQNKTAATRYRQKKRVEHDQLNSEREELESKNQELKEKAESISREIQYLKDLMEEVRKHHRGKTLSAA